MSFNATGAQIILPTCVTAVQNLDQHLPFFQRGDFHVIDDERFMQLPEYSRADFHALR